MISSQVAESPVNQSYETLQHSGNRQERQQHVPIQNVSFTHVQILHGDIRQKLIEPMLLLCFYFLYLQKKA